MPSAHYQRVLEQDQQLPAPLRWLTRAMSSWWMVGILAVLVVGYVAAAHVPIGGRYLWQHRVIDTTQHAMLTWPPLQISAVLLAVVIVWSAFRRLPMRRDSLGRFVCVMGLATILVSQSWSFRYQTLGVAAVPVTPTQGDGPANPTQLGYTTRYGDPTGRVLIVQLGTSAPIAIPLDALPRWNDAAGASMPKLNLSSDPKLASALGFATRIEPTAYLADGQLTEDATGEQTATPTPTNQRSTALPYPANALLAIVFTSETNNAPITTTVWLPFEPDGVDTITPNRVYNIDGLGTIGLAFRPVSNKMAFAMAAEAQSPRENATLHAADADSQGRLFQPAVFRFNTPSDPPASYAAIEPESGERTYALDWIDPGLQHRAPYLYVAVSTQPAKPFIVAGLATFVLGVVLDFLVGGRTDKKRKDHMPAPSQPGEPDRR